MPFKVCENGRRNSANFFFFLQEKHIKKLQFMNIIEKLMSVNYVVFPGNQLCLNNPDTRLKTVNVDFKLRCEIVLMIALFHEVIKSTRP